MRIVAKATTAFAFPAVWSSYQSHQDNHDQPNYAKPQMPARTYYTYIMSSRTRVLYIGITSNLELRVQQHKQGTHDGFTKEYRCHHLVWFERYSAAASAIAREKQFKGWRRAKKLALIEQQNLEWQDLSKDWGKSFTQPASAAISADTPNPSSS